MLFLLTFTFETIQVLLASFNELCSRNVFQWLVL